MIDIEELRPAVEAAGLNAISTQEVLELLDRLEAAEKERDAARELADRLALALNTSNHERDNLRSSMKFRTSLIGRTEAERDALRAKIEQMERQEPVAFALYSGWAFKAAYRKEHEACDQRDRRQLSADLGGSLEAYRVVPLYALPGAKGEEK